MARLEDLAKLDTRADSGPVRRAMRNLHTALGTRLAQQNGDDEAVHRAHPLQLRFETA